MPKGQRTNAAEAQAAARTPAVRKTPQQKAEEAYLKAFNAHDAAENAAIEADKAAKAAWDHVKYTQRVRDHAAYHPDLPEDFDGPAFVAAQQQEPVTAETATEPVEPEPTKVEKVEAKQEPVAEPKREPAPEPVSDDDPFAGIG